MISGGSAASVGDQCVVVAAAADTDGMDPLHTPFSEWIGTLVLKNTQAPPSSNVGSGGAAYNPRDPLAVGESRGIRSGGVPRGGGAVGSREYQATSEACTVNSATGQVTANTQGEQCTVQARWAGNNNYLPSAWVTIWQFTVEPAGS